MEIRHLKTFKTIVDIGGFTRAADYLGYAQSTVTSHVQAIEQELRKPLFYRLGKKMMLTEAGKHLLPYAAEMVELYEKARHIPENDQEPAGNLIIGASESLTVYRLPAILHEFTNKYPQVTVTLKSSTCWQLRDELKQGKIDVAFLLDNDRKENDLHVEKLVNEPMVFIFHKEHPAGQKALDDLTFTANETFLYTEHGCSYRDFFEEYLRQRGVIADHTMEFWSVEAIKQCVMCGLGVSLLPLITTRTDIEEGKLQGTLVRDALFSTQMVYHKNKWLSPAMAAFTDIVRRKARDWAQT
ncbi:LysR family transcriptional regulator [Bacillus haynesii]|uniref:LysR family transcriptional regulator n=1 Tax=Bacillus haynesii TaxID=1925021 RepID=UPI00227E5390|nr:LysR family transcriptional regulator [Bacillus haynesii]MCY7848507.1 LysR family transcriptional regulator [Bacillus haynesii]MCY7999510.1 LysR family transcriptional regulator [Bacillus haynesii]MCY8005136.1 LysR family transcriptional regulator [Bacillus haynesii]MCY8075876.1 LysR family transcriptional regulator [Bacillus haynesii]MCY8100556.1 LysR family transcriptional regulator [Bacillus haynesii]